MKATKCPNCGQYKLWSNRDMTIIVGISGIVVSFVFLVFIITWPLAILSFVIGVGAFIAAPFAKGSWCTHCKYRGQTAPHGGNDPKP